MMKRFLTLLALISSTYLIAQIPTAGLVAYYPFNGNANDENPNSPGTYNGTIHGGTIVTEDRRDVANSAYAFDGSGDYIDIGNPPGLDLTGPFSISVWAMGRGSTGNGSLHGIVGKGPVDPFGLAIDDGDRIMFKVVSGGISYSALASSQVTDITEWYHYVGVFNPGNSVVLYRDGIEIERVSGSIPSNIDNSSQNLWIGSRASSTTPTSPGYFFQGSLDDIRIYNVVLSQGDIDALYNEGNSPPPGGPSLWTQSGSNIYYNSGNVGIGTTNPLSLLSVNGLIRAEEIKVVTDVDVPDYVFEPDYPLRSLDDLRSYIYDKGHLPDIPSAAEIQLANGFELGDMDMRLLRKIEELTLYTLEQEKLLDQYKRKIENQEIRLLNQRSMISEILKRIEKLEIKL